MKNYSAKYFCLIFLFIGWGTSLSAQNSIINTDSIQIDGDFRYRHEYFNQEGVDNFNRHQLRARLRLISNVSTSVDFVFQIATGEGDAPFSTDQTLTGSFSSKHIWVDKAYAKWNPENYKGFVLVAGKAPNPFYRPNNNQLLWNPDVFVEGLSVKYRGEGSSLNFFLLASSYWMEQRAAGDDSWLFAWQGGIDYSVSNINIIAGTTYYGYTNTKGSPPFWDAGNSFGNSVDSSGKYLNDYKLVELFAKISFKKITIPFSLFTDVVLNNGADRENLAFLIGATIGNTDKPLDWTFGYSYRQIETDALIGLLNDPDFAGGVTNSKGHKLNIAMLLTSKIVADFTYYHSTMGIDNGEYYRRAQLAINLAF